MKIKKLLATGMLLVFTASASASEMLINSAADMAERMKPFATNIKNEWFEIGNLQMVIDRVDESLQPKEKISLDLYKK